MTAAGGAAGQLNESGRQGFWFCAMSEAAVLWFLKQSSLPFHFEQDVTDDKACFQAQTHPSAL